MDSEPCFKVPKHKSPLINIALTNAHWLAHTRGYLRINQLNRDTNFQPSTQTDEGREWALWSGKRLVAAIYINICRRLLCEGVHHTGRGGCKTEISKAEVPALGGHDQRCLGGAMQKLRLIEKVKSMVKSGGL